MESWDIAGEDGYPARRGVERDLISVVIVNYNAGAVLRRSLGAVLSSSVPVEVLLVDNGSTDSSISDARAYYGNDPRLTIIENRANLGFARANNTALKRARGRYILLLNPDCVVQPDTLERVAHQLKKEPTAGMAGCLLRNQDGTEQPGCRRSVPTPWRTMVRVFHLDRLFPSHPRFRNFVLSREPLPDRPTLIEATSGAFMLVRREAIAQVGPLDEGYFLHCEDLDWCMRFRKQNWKILFVPDVEVVHYQGSCSVNRPLFVSWHKHRGMVRFYRKFFRHQYPLPLMALVAGAVWTRFTLLAMREVSQLAVRRVRSLPVARGKTRPLATIRGHFRIQQERRTPGSEVGYTGLERRTNVANSIRLP